MDTKPLWVNAQNEHCNECTTDGTDKSHFATKENPGNFKESKQETNPEVGAVQTGKDTKTRCTTDEGRKHSLFGYSWVSQKSVRHVACR